MYSMKPSFLNLFKKKFTRERVVPIISASVSCEIFGTSRHRLVLLAVARQQQQRPRQPLLARVEELIDQVLFDADVAREHVGDEAVGHRVLLVQQPHHLLLADEQDRARGDRGGAAHADGWPARQPSPKKSPGPSMATTASLPVLDSTESFTPPVWMYRTASQGSPCVKIGSPRPYAKMFFPKPAASRKLWMLNAIGSLSPSGVPFTGSMAETFIDHSRHSRSSMPRLRQCILLRTI